MAGKLNIRVRLSVMMFFQFFIWGSWFVTLGTFLSGSFEASGSEAALAFSSQSYGAILAPLVVGQIADRFLNAERILGVLHLIGAALMWAMYRSADFDAFLPYVIGYMIAYMPTLALVNAISFRQLSNPATQFGWIRVWGTIGWIVAGFVISLMGWDSQEAVAEGALRYTFILGAIVSFVLCLYSFTLPATPPSRVNGESLTDRFGLSALWLLKDRNFLVFFAASVLICIPLGFYYQNASPFLTEIGMSNATAKLSVGQMSEVLCMLLLPVFLGRFGIKKTLLVGMAAWTLRYALFAAGFTMDAGSMIILGIALHGVCYDFFFVCGQIYTDGKAGESCKSSAQGMITLATYGVGMLVGFSVAGQITDLFAMGAKHNWVGIWLVPAGLAFAILAVFKMTFRAERIAGA